jgi:hypothetical protein
MTWLDLAAGIGLSLAACAAIIANVRSHLREDDHA